MWDSIRALVASGVTIFLTTQYLDEADELADQIAVLDHGRIVAEGSAEQLKQRIPGGHVQLEFADAQALELASGFLEGATSEGGRLALRVPNDGSVSSLRRLLAELDERQIEVERLSMHTPDLDDVFFAVTGHQTTEEEAVL